MTDDIPNSGTETGLESAAESGLHNDVDNLQLQRSEKLYRHLVEHSLGLICSHTLSGELLSVNSAAAQALDWSPQELIGKNLRDLMPEEVRPRFDIYISRIKRLGRARGYMDLVTRSGEVVTWVYRNLMYEESGVEPIVIGHAQDITWRLRLERSLKESSDQFRALFEDAPVAYHELDARGTITKVNRAECAMLGYAKEELLGRPVWELVAPEEREQSREQVRRKLAGETPLVPFLRPYLKKDGGRLWLNIHEKPIFSHSGLIMGIRTTLLDVTEQVRIDSELRRLNSELDHRVAERTADLNATTERLKEFVYTVSHDLQEPLRSISSFAKLLRSRYGSQLDTDGIEFLDYVTGGAQRMSSLIKDLLSYSRVLHDEDLSFKTVALDEVVDVACQNLSMAILKSGAEIGHDTLPTIVANPVRMVQLFQNLLGNAIKYRGESPPRIHVSARVISGGWMISITDNGIGIRPEERDRIFGLFSRAHRTEAHGYGVGLAICQAIVERHGGRIWVEPAAGGGSVFLFTISDRSGSTQAPSN